MISRRMFLGSTALIGAAAILGLTPRLARALRAEEDEVRERLYLAACEGRGEHDELVRELIAGLEGEQGRVKAVEIVRAMNCPYCGCALAAFAGASPAN
jgi:hypothetical protein